MFFIRQNATHKVVLGPAVAVGDGFTPVTNLDVATSDEAEAILHDNGTVVDISGYTWNAIATADGYYHLTLASGISGTVGHMTVVVNDDDLILPLRADFTVLEEAVYDAMYAASATGPLQSTTGGRKLTVSANGEGNADMTFIHGTALTETAGQLAAAFKKFFDVASPTATAVSLPDAVPDAAGGLPISDAGGLDLDNMVLNALKAAGIVLHRATIETVNSQTEFVIPATDDATDNDAYNGAIAVIIDGTDANQVSIRRVTDYVASTRAVTIELAADFTVTGSDTLVILTSSVAQLRVGPG